MSTWFSGDDDLTQPWPWWKRWIGAWIISLLLALEWCARLVDRVMVAVEDLWIWWRR